MKRIAILALALLLLIQTAALADIISGDSGSGWWDDSFSGTWNYISEAGLRIKLPDDWCENLLEDSGEYLFMRDDYYITLSVDFFPESLFDLADSIESNDLWYDGYPCEESATIILKDDRDWYIIANDFAYVAFTYGENGGTVAFSFNYDTEGGDVLTSIRQIISSIEAY